MKRCRATTYDVEASGSWKGGDADHVKASGSREAPAATDATSVLADLETWEGASAAVEKALTEFGRIDVAIHVVGGTIWAKPTKLTVAAPSYHRRRSRSSRP